MAIAFNFPIFSYLYKLLVIFLYKNPIWAYRVLPHCEEEQAVTRAPLAIATRITRYPYFCFLHFFVFHLTFF